MNQTYRALDCESSFVKADALQQYVLPEFDIGRVNSCELFWDGANDSYKVNTSRGNFLLRLYAHGWRTRPEILFEVEALVHLNNKGAPVSAPIAAQNGEFLIEVPAPEGLRYALLMTFAEEDEFWDGDDNIWRQYASHVAAIHDASDDFRSLHQRDELNIRALLDKPLEIILPFIASYPDMHEYLIFRSQKLRIEISTAAEKNMDFGFCHGDFHGGNAHIKNGSMQFFDFDCCGYGYRSYDLAVFKWNRLHNELGTHWTWFIDSYKTHRKRTIVDDDISLVDTYVSVRHIWWMAYFIKVQPAIGMFNETFFRQQIEFLKTLEQI